MVLECITSHPQFLVSPDAASGFFSHHVLGALTKQLRSSIWDRPSLTAAAKRTQNDGSTPKLLPASLNAWNKAVCGPGTQSACVMSTDLQTETPISKPPLAQVIWRTQNVYGSSRGLNWNTWVSWPWQAAAPIVHSDMILKDEQTRWVGSLEP